MTYSKGVHSRVGHYVAQCMKDVDEFFAERKECHIRPFILDGQKLIINWLQFVWLSSQTEYRQIATSKGEMTRSLR